MTITENCFVPDMSDDDYHNDPCEGISLSSGMAKSLLYKTEIQTWLNSKRLNRDCKSKATKAMDLGNLAHAKILGKGSAYEVAPFKDFRTKEAREAKEQILAAGKIALSETEADKILPSVAAMHDRLHSQLAEHSEYGDLFADGESEVSAFANDGDIWNRARFDRLRNDGLIVDYKTTGLSIEQWEKNQLWSDGGFLQEVHYRRVYELVKGEKPKDFVYVVQESFAPYLVRVVVLDESIREEIERRYNYARQRFIDCLASDKWRGHPPITAHSFPAPWVVKAWEVTEAEESMKQPEQSEQSENVYMAG